MVKKVSGNVFFNRFKGNFYSVGLGVKIGLCGDSWGMPLNIGNVRQHACSILGLYP